MCKIGGVQKIGRELWQFGSSKKWRRMDEVMKKHDVYIATTPKYMYDGLKSLLGDPNPHQVRSRSFW
jgi:hypothetical protein